MKNKDKAKIKALIEENNKLRKALTNLEVRNANLAIGNLKQNEMIKVLKAELKNSN